MTRRLAPEPKPGAPGFRWLVLRVPDDGSPATVDSVHDSYAEAAAVLHGIPRTAAPAPVRH